MESCRHIFSTSFITFQHADNKTFKCYCIRQVSTIPISYQLTNSPIKLHVTCYYQPVDKKIVISSTKILIIYSIKHRDRFESCIFQCPYRFSKLQVVKKKTSNLMMCFINKVRTSTCNALKTSFLKQQEHLIVLYSLVSKDILYY